MSYKITTSLQRIISMDSRIKIVKGATYSGKTFNIILVMIDIALSKVDKGEKWRARVVAETVPSVKGGALNIFRDNMTEMGIWDDNKYNGTDREYSFSNNVKIRFTAYDTVGKAKQAGKWDVLFINEINHGKAEIYNELIARTDGDVWVDYNPDALFWVDTELIKHPEASQITVTYKDNEATPEAKLIEFAYKRELALTSKYWENWCRVYLDGLTGSVEGVIFPDFTIIPTIPKEAKLINHGIDWGWEDHTAIISRYAWNGGVIAHQVAYSQAISIDEIIRLLKSIPKAPIMTDTNVPILNDHLERNGIKTMKAVKGAGSVDANLEIMKQTAIFVTEDSTQLIADMREYRKVDGEYYGRHHGIDAFRYTFHRAAIPKTLGGKTYKKTYK